MRTDFSFVVKTILREKCLRELLKSLRKYYPETLVYVADDSKVPYPEAAEGFPPVVYATYEEDLGIGKCLNDLLLRVQTPYVVLLDDDFLFSRFTDIECLLEMLDSGEGDLIGGGVRKLPTGKLQTFIGDFAGEKGDELNQMDAYTLFEPIRVDVTMNFYAARRDLLLRVKYNDTLKVARHMDFYRRLKAVGAKVFYHPGCIVDHATPWGPREYNALRYGRLSEFRKKYLEIHGFEEKKSVLT